MLNRRILFFVAALTLAFGRPAIPAEVDYQELTNLVQQFKKDPRGPFQAIKWFCPDGSIIPARERCKERGGIQHAYHKDNVREIADKHHIFFGQILAGTGKEDFFDAVNQNSRLKQYQLEKFLHAADDGWIMRRARYYRGAYQAEDEEAWGESFLQWLTMKNTAVESQFFLIRQIARDIPHIANDDKLTEIRQTAKVIADSLPSFMNIRIKIHGQPDETDLERVRKYRSANQGKIPASMNSRLQQLEQDMAAMYSESGIAGFETYLDLFPVGSPAWYNLSILLGRVKDDAEVLAIKDPIGKTCGQIADLLISLRNGIPDESDPAVRVEMIDLSLELESMLFRSIGKWQPTSLRELLAKTYVLAKSAAGCGYLELWEWLAVEAQFLAPFSREDITIRQLLNLSGSSDRVVQWSTSMFSSVYTTDVEQYEKFEPLVHGFVDDKIRSSMLLPLGEVAGQLSALASGRAGITNNILNIPSQSGVRGLNPGFARGELVVITGSPEGVPIHSDKIYVMQRPPSDLKPIAGIATVTEGNAVSHVQLLARNLAIPNAVIAAVMLPNIAEFAGQEVFYAVSPKGSVLMKPAVDMTDEERALFTEEEHQKETITVPIDELQLDETDILRLDALRAQDSGLLCGPKAANLGQLKHLFPDNVSNGLVIPFGVYREHLEQPYPGNSKFSYWDVLEAIFVKVRKDRADGVDKKQIKSELLARMTKLRQAIREIPFLPEFERSLRNMFLQEFGVGLGQIPVFIRSDTNMEDLGDFTGAGLNLTVVNIVKEEDVLQSIRSVWASPFTERSFEWREQLLSNPEDVYPSILILPTVNSDKSGVLITTGLEIGDSDDITVAMNWGSTGAVEGQQAETYLLDSDGPDILLSPARETEYNSLPETGGIIIKHVFFNEQILSEGERHILRLFTQELRNILPGAPGIETDGPFDVELGFWNNKIILFQVRPFVENQLAQSSGYLNAMDAAADLETAVSLESEF